MREQTAGASEVVIVRDNGDRSAFGQKLFRVRDIFDGGGRFILQNQPFRVRAVRYHVVLHGLRLGAWLIAALSAAENGAAVLVRVQHADRRVTPCRQRRRRLSVRVDECAERQ